MSACLDREPHLVEYARCASGVVEECIVRGIELLSTWIGSFHGQCDPVPELQSLAHDRRKLDRELGGCIEEERSSRFQHAAAFENPPSAPGQVLLSCHRVVVSILVVLAKIEWWICKDGVYDMRFHSFQDMEAVGVVQGSVGCCQTWLFHLTHSRSIKGSVQQQDVPCKPDKLLSKSRSGRPGTEARHEGQSCRNRISALRARMWLRGESGGGRGKIRRSVVSRNPIDSTEEFLAPDASTHVFVS